MRLVVVTKAQLIIVSV